jgi:hypothetical protein
VCGSLGWRLPNGTAVRLQDLTVRQGTQLQVLPAHVAIAPRHASFVSRVRAFDALPPTAPLPQVCRVLSRWWRLRVPNVYKESAWRVTLDAFPTACRMGLLQSPCVACGVMGPDVGHHFWSCEVAQAVRQEVEGQLRAWGWLDAHGHISCASLWLAQRPDQRLMTWVWDLVCVAALHAMEVGRSTAWAVAQEMEVPVLVAQVASRAAKAAFWSALADFAATTRVPRRLRGVRLTAQPFIAWHVVLVVGNGLRVMRR